MNDLSDRGSNLEITQHPHFERHWRRVQTIIIAIMAALLVAGLLGLLGSGPLSRTALDYPEAKVKYQRFGRAGAPQQIEVEARDVAAGPLSVQIDKSLATKLGLEAVAPPPSSSTTGMGGTQYVYSAAAGGGMITLRGKPQMPGLVRGVIAINGRSENISQIVWP
jgi:hypothetical protein